MINKAGTRIRLGWYCGAKINGMIMKLPDPSTRLKPGLNIKLISRTSLVARAIVSPTGCKLWKVMLLPSRLT